MKNPTIALTATLALLTGALRAEDSGDTLEALKKRLDTLELSNKALSDQVKKLKDEAITNDDVQGVNNSLESFKYQYQRDRETATPTSARGITIGGLVQTRYGFNNIDLTQPPVQNPPPQASVGTSNPTVVDHRNNSFDLSAVQVFFAGSLYRDYAEGRNLTFNLRLGTAPQTGTNNNFANLLDANVVYSPLPTTSQDIDKMTITFGQQTLPFGLEVNTTDELRPVINNAQFVGPTGLGGRQIGLIIRGDDRITYDYGYNYRSSLWSYNFGIVNGNGANIADDNNFKDYVGRVDFKVPTEYNSWLRELRIGFSGYYGKDPIVATPTAPAGAPAFVVKQGERERWGIDLYYNHFPFGVTYEYVLALDDVNAGTQNAPRTAKQRGTSNTATFFYSFGQNFLASQKATGRFDDWWPRTWQPFFRFDLWTPDGTNVNPAQARDRHIEIDTLGLNVFFAQTTKAQVNFNRRVESSATTQHSTSYEVLAQLQYGF